MNITSSTTATPLSATRRRSSRQRGSTSLLSRDSFLGRWLSGVSAAVVMTDAVSSSPTSGTTDSKSCSGNSREVLVERLTQELKDNKKQTFQLSAQEVRLLLNLPPAEDEKKISSDSGGDGRKLTPFETTMMKINEDKSCEITFEHQQRRQARSDSCLPPPAFTIEQPKSTIKAATTASSNPRTSSSNNENNSNSSPVHNSAVPPPVKPLQPTSNVFDSWDMNSKENLSPEEIQAVMLALMAAEGGSSNVPNMNGSTAGDGSENFPLPLSALKRASIHRLISDDTAATTDFVVTFDDIDGEDEVSECTTPPDFSDETIRNIWAGDHPSFEEDDDGKLVIPLPALAPSGFASRPNMMSCRNYTIQPFPEEEDPPQLSSAAATAGDNNNKPPAPLRLSCRQASVRPLKRNKQGDSGKAFVVSLPVAGDDDNNKKAAAAIPTSTSTSVSSGSSKDKAPKLVSRQITLQRHQWNSSTEGGLGGGEGTTGISASSLSTDGGGASTSGTRRRPTMFRMNGQQLSYYPTPLDG